MPKTHEVYSFFFFDICKPATSKMLRLAVTRSRASPAAITPVHKAGCGCISRVKGTKTWMEDIDIEVLADGKPVLWSLLPYKGDCKQRPHSPK